ncbi:Glutamine--tRNA ligase [Candidatus Providencia siddallii]|uniref:Glutamine--tRNA ligase n=1 Tax=Candidatus Providencia siddallii TaxID=1715285 RepID=A0A0M6W800_9GAMM|nr:Glutamine--tRNA ligase [Candidatus Providencia siddallii]
MNKTNIHKKNFIYQIIENDLINGKHVLIRTRFPPEPNGYLHIGHAKSICLNFGIANKYKGRCNLRFDDTNPVKENIDYINSIKKDIEWLGFKWCGDIRYSSDYFDILYKHAIDLIKKGLAYVDELTSEEIRKYRGTLKQHGRDSPYRKRSVKDNLLLFHKMRAGEFKEGKACLRAKIDMASSFMIMRDPVLYRIKFVKHHQLGNKWCIYPMYDFAHCISDAIEGITHSLCTLEFLNNKHLYNWILDNIKIDSRPSQYEFSRLNIEYSVLSKRKLNKLIFENYVTGWDDPRMLTISGLRRRGYTSSSIRNFCYHIGVTKQDSNIKLSTLEFYIRSDLNESAFRVMAVINPVLLVIENMADCEKILIAKNHPNKPELGIRNIPFSNKIYIDRADFSESECLEYYRLMIGKEVRLRYSYIIKAEHIEKDEKGDVKIIYCSYDPDTLNKNPVDGRRVKGVIHWVSKLHALPAEIRLYDRLFTVPNPDINKDFLSTVNKKSLVICNGFVEPSLCNAKSETPYQFEREGYFCADSCLSNKNNLVFNKIVGLRDTWSKIKKNK